MSASEHAPPDACDPCPRCGWELLAHDVTADGAMIHPDGERVCVDPDGAP